MNVNAINGDNIYPVQSRIEVNNKKNELAHAKALEENAAHQKADKLEISTEGKKMMLIQSRMNSAFYDKPEVMKDIALKISKSIPPE